MKTAANLVAFFATLLGLLIGWSLMGNGGSLKSPLTWVLSLIGFAIVWAIIRALYYKDRTNSTDHSKSAS